ncbi:hypothetical protein HK101_003993 [Irineochytrium annulatum]|nr:hypothetical protein HK101_003993 [Irineochytrium annulatum]
MHVRALIAVAVASAVGALPAAFEDQLVLVDAPKDNLLRQIGQNKITRDFRGVLDDYEDVAAVLNGSVELTVFAPSDAALDRAGRIPVGDPTIDNLLLYHIVMGPRDATSMENNGLLDTLLVLDTLGNKPQKIKTQSPPHDDGIYLNGNSKLVERDHKASNGILHVIDRVLTPPEVLLLEFYHLLKSTQNIGKLLLKNPFDFSIFLLGLRRTNLLDAMVEGNGLTVFAPTNRAFRTMGFRKLRYLFSDFGSNDLKQILLFHVSPKLLYSHEIKGETKLPTLFNGAPLLLSVEKEDDEQGHVHEIIEVNHQGHVVFDDLLASNAVMHGIDHVLSLPSHNMEAECDEEDEEESEGFLKVLELLSTFE